MGGLYGILLYAILAVFIAGLMVGRTPEYLGKKIEQKEVKMAMLPIMATSLLHSGFHGPQHRPPFAKGDYWNPPGPAIANLNNGGPHGFSESCTPIRAPRKQRQRVRGINANTPWYNLTLGLAMLFGRFMFLVPLLAVAGSLAAKRRIPAHQRDVSHAWPAFCRAAGGDGGYCWCADFLPGAVAGPDRGAFPDA